MTGWLNGADIPQVPNPRYPEEVKLNPTPVLATSGSGVRLNKHASGAYSWTIAVDASGDSIEELEAAKRVALELTRQLDAELNATEPKDPEEVPF